MSQSDVVRPLSPVRKVDAIQRFTYPQFCSCERLTVRIGLDQKAQSEAETTRLITSLCRSDLPRVAPISPNRGVIPDWRAPGAMPTARRACLADLTGSPCPHKVLRMAPGEEEDCGLS